MIEDKPTSAPEPPTVTCSAGCKREIQVSQLATAGWELLPISGRYRCGSCWRELQAVNNPSPAVSA